MNSRGVCEHERAAVETPCDAYLKMMCDCVKGRAERARDIFRRERVSNLVRENDLTMRYVSKPVTVVYLSAKGVI